MILTLVALILIISIGFLTCSYLRIFTSTLQTLSISYAIGIGIIYLLMFSYTLLHIQWNLWVILLPILSYLLLMMGISHRTIKKKKINWHLSLSEKTVLLGILILVLFVGFESIVRPVYAWDAWSSWLMKSKMFYIEKGITSNQLHYLNSEYPPLISIGGAFVYIITQSLDDRHVLLFFFLFYVFLGFSIFSLLSKSTNRFIALIGTFLFLSTQNIIRHGGRFEAGQADLALSYFMVCVYMLFIEFVRVKNIKLLLLLEFILSVTILVKNEGLPFVLLIQVLLIPSIFSLRSIKKISMALLFLIIPAGMWISYKYMNHLPGNYIFQDFHYNYFDMKNILLFMGKEFINIEHWNLLWITFFIVSVFWIFQNKQEKNELYNLYIVIGFQLFVYFLIFMITPVSPPFMHVQNVFDRLLIHISPFALLIAVNAIWYYVSKKKI